MGKKHSQFQYHTEDDRKTVHFTCGVSALEMKRMTLCVKQRPWFCIAPRSRVKVVMVKRVVVNGSLGRCAEVKRRRRGGARDTVSLCVSELLSSCPRAAEVQSSTDR